MAMATATQKQRWWREGGGGGRGRPVVVGQAVGRQGLLKGMACLHDYSKASCSSYWPFKNGAYLMKCQGRVEAQRVLPEKSHTISGPCL